MVIPINPKRSPKYGNWGGLVGIRGRELSFFIYLSPSKQGLSLGKGWLCIWRPWGGWQWKETMGLIMSFGQQKHMKSHDTSCGLGIGAGTGFLDFLSPVAGREMR